MSDLAIYMCNVFSVKTISDNGKKIYRISKICIPLIGS